MKKKFTLTNKQTKQVTFIYIRERELWRSIALVQT